jgi:hypothetical protein
MRSGSTGAMIPKATISNATMTRIKRNAVAPGPEVGGGAGVVVSAIRSFSGLNLENHGKD